MDKNPSLPSGNYAIVVDKSNQTQVNVTQECVLRLRPDGSISVSLFHQGNQFSEFDVVVEAGSTIDTFTLRLKQRFGYGRIVILIRKTTSMTSYSSTAHDWRLGHRPVVLYPELIHVLEYLVTRR